MSVFRRAGLAALFVLVATSSARAQVTETGVAFDSAGKVRTLTPALVTRFDLKPPAWPVAGEFREARLFDVSTGGHVLAVERQDQRIERYPLAADHVAALRFAIDAAMTKSGAAVTEDRAQMNSEPARGAFVRNQMILTWALYGPLLASIADDEKGGTALYLAATSASYFITTGISRKTTITRAQNHLATDGALRGWGVGAGIMYTLVGDADFRAYSTVGLAGALTGAIGGFKRGKAMTDSEAEATTAISNLAAATALGLSGATGLINETDDGRAMTGAIVAAGIAGYAWGPSYPRRAKYTVTRGDIQVTSTGALLGIAAAVTPIVDSDMRPEPFFGAATLGLLAGTYLAERNWARRYDHSTWDAGQTSLGMAAGALMGSAVVVLAEPSSPRAVMGMVTSGAIFGAIVGHNLASPARAGVAGVDVTSPSRPARRRVEVELNVSDVALSALKVPGRHALVNVRF